MSEAPAPPPAGRGATLVTERALTHSTQEREEIGSYIEASTRQMLDYLASLPVREPPQVLEQLGRGGMATVQLAFDPILQREVALKELHEHVEATSPAGQDLLFEARITADLQHPNIVPVHEIAKTVEGRPYFTMQVVEGRNLRQWSKHPGRPLGSRDRIERGLAILLRVLDAIGYAHARGVLHLDLKPDNIMVGPYGRVYVMDWGLAENINAAVRRRRVAGTPAYMAPEQARGEVLDERADIFAVGAILFELLTGKTPYGDLTQCSLAVASQGQLIDLEASLDAAGVPPSMQKIVTAALAPTREERLPKLDELRAALIAYLREGWHLPQLKFEPGDWIVREGEAGRCAYMIQSGKCEVFVSNAETQQERHLRDLQAGDLFGELALFLEGKRTASVRALSPTTVWVLDRAVMEEAGVMQGWASKLLRQLATRFTEAEAMGPQTRAPQTDEAE